MMCLSMYTLHIPMIYRNLKKNRKVFQNILDNTHNFHSLTFQFMWSCVTLVYIDFSALLEILAASDRSSDRSDGDEDFLFSAGGHLSRRATGNRFLCHSHNGINTPMHLGVLTRWLVDSLTRWSHSLALWNCDLWRSLKSWNELNLENSRNMRGIVAGSRHRPQAMEDYEPFWAQHLSIIWSGIISTKNVENTMENAAKSIKKWSLYYWLLYDSIMTIWQTNADYSAD